MRQECEGNLRERGTSLVEVMISLGISAVLAVMGATFYTHLEAFNKQTTAEYSAQAEGYLLLSELRKAYGIDIIQATDPSRRIIPSVTTIKGKVTTSSGIVNNAILGSTTTFTTFSAGRRVDVFSIGNHCSNVPPVLRKQLPELSPSYLQRVFARERVRFENGEVSDDATACSLALGAFQCGTDQTSYVELQNFEGGRTLRVPQNIAPGGKWNSSSVSAVAAFVCENRYSYSDSDLRGFKDISIFVATIDMSRPARDVENRLRWQRLRLVIAPTSRNDNVQYCTKCF